MKRPKRKRASQNGKVDSRILYKYSQAKWGISILRELRLRLTPPSEFNDPFEFTPVTANPLNTPNELQTYLQEKGESSSIESLKKVIPALKVNNRIAREFGSNLTESDMDEQIEAGKVLGVLCLSKPHADMRMWAYYGDSHRGLAIGLDFERYQGTAISYFEMVRYSIKRAAASVLRTIDKNSDIKTIEKFEKQQLNIALTKSTDWKDEQEYRIICKLANLQREPRGPNGSDGFNYFLHINPETIRKVILGCKIAEQDELVVKSICNAKAPHAEIIKLQRHPTHFKLIPKPA
jgi:hypothetical protein